MCVALLLPQRTHCTESDEDVNSAESSQPIQHIAIRDFHRENDFD